MPDQNDDFRGIRLSVEDIKQLIELSKKPGDAKAVTDATKGASPADLKEKVAGAGCQFGLLQCG